MEDQVYIVECANYDQTEDRMVELLDMMGGMAQFVAPGERIALKVNLLTAAPPEKAVTTHPAVVAAAGKLAKAAGGHPTIVDSPGSGFGYNERMLDRVYQTCGMYDAAQKADISVNRDTTYRSVSFPDGALTKRLDVITPVAEADGVINLSKLKTHTYMGMTGAIKNSFGVIPGLAKPPRLSIMDSVVGMEGDGPSAGTPKHTGLLLASTNPLALDVVASEIIGLRRENNPVLVEAEKRGLYPTRIKDVRVVGTEVANLWDGGYQLPATFSSGVGFTKAAWWQRALMPLFKDGLTVRPRVMKKRCVGCGVCHKACPVKAITMVDSDDTSPGKHATINDQECIRCYCCHEMCPEDAIELRSSLLYRALNG